VQSIAIATADETGEDPGTDEDVEESAVPGETVESYAIRCPGSSPCAIDPTNQGQGARASASTDFGVNRARAYAAEDVDVNLDNDVYETASASSFWVDEWVFSAVSITGPVTIEFGIEGAWSNGGGATFYAAVADSTLPPIVNPDDPEPFLNGQLVGLPAQLDTSGIALTGVPPFFVPFEDAGEPDGTVDVTLALRFTPVPGRTYLVGARLAAGTIPELSFSEADFDSTARVTRVVVPAGVTFSSAGTYDVVPVPEPGTLSLVAAAVGGLAAARGRRLR
jgi:hypothetical protein